MEAAVRRANSGLSRIDFVIIAAVLGVGIAAALTPMMMSGGPRDAGPADAMLGVGFDKHRVFDFRLKDGTRCVTLSSGGVTCEWGCR
jgi:hypothetical protein